MNYLQKLVLVVYSLLLGQAATALQAQHNYDLYNLGDLIYISPGEVVTVQGDVHMQGGSFSNNGFLEVQGNLYSDNTFQQTGIGTLRLENNDVNVADTQFISGSWAVRGGTAAIGLDDGSFYDLELANTQGIVYLVGAGYIADVRNRVDFQPSGASGSPPLNRVITHDINAGLPANGSMYDGVFGIMNDAPGFLGMPNNTVTTNGNTSGVDAGYVQGRLRRAIRGAGGQYPYVLGLEPAGAGAQRGMQYTRLDFGPNSYDVVEGYFETGSPNVIPGTPVECGFSVNYFGGIDHGEWNFEEIGSGSGSYEVWVWPQDDNFPGQSTWFITKDDSIRGNIGQCGPSPVGLNRSAFNGFSEFGVAAGSMIFPITLTSLDAVPMDNRYIQVRWTTMDEENSDHFEVERGLDNVNFSYLGQKPAAGNSSALLHYDLDDREVVPGREYYYRLKSVDKDGGFVYSASVNAKLLPGGWQPEVRVYPNPVAEGDLYLDIQVGEGCQARLYVVDGRGKVVMELKLELTAGANHAQLNVSDLAAGPYQIRLEGGGISVSRTFVKVE